MLCLVGVDFEFRSTLPSTSRCLRISSWPSTQALFTGKFEHAEIAALSTPTEQDKRSPSVRMFASLAHLS